ncbi:hypothetical protein RJ639_036443 [Escallonia herrerae]|uniref:Pentatricopeptide repeat-containing protein n=1 Tax=Escallonia herrerae TaxID=1293975 RepID=A0AA88WWR8_9ASTE|nr:hypothetical protein RJ639_036443 [Escallonia herrerae]
MQQLSSLLNATNVRCFDCKQIHGHILKLGALKWNHSIGNMLAMLYLKSSENGSLDDARRVFDEMPEGTLPLYAALVGSCSRASRWEELFSVLELMVHDGFLPNKYLIPTVLKACAALQFLKTGRMVHGYAVRKELGADAFVVNALIDMYANCGDLRSSRTVFDVMKERDVVSWTALVSAYMDRGLLHEAEEIFNSMQVNPDLISWNALISGFARHGEIQRAVFYLEALQEQGLMPRVNSWNGIISGCVQNGYFQEALDLLSKMLWFPERPNGVTIACILPACAGLDNVRMGKAIHGYAIKNELYGNIHVQGSVIDMYSKCGRCDSAEKVFFGVKDKNNVVWNEMIAAYANEGKMDAAFGLLISMQCDGLQPDEITYNTLLAAHARRGKKNEAYALVDEMSQMDFKLNIISFNILVSGFQQSGLSNEALKLFRVMQSPSDYCFSDGLPDVSIQPNSVTTTGALAACSDLNLLWQGKEIHGYVVKNKFESNIFVSSALVDMYAKCHDLGSANKAFWKIENKNTVAWNSIIASHTNNSQPEKAFNLFCEMLCEDTQPSSITFMILLPACGHQSAKSKHAALQLLALVCAFEGAAETSHQKMAEVLETWSSTLPS